MLASYVNLLNNGAGLANLLITKDQLVQFARNNLPPNQYEVIQSIGERIFVPARLMIGPGVLVTALSTITTLMANPNVRIQINYGAWQTLGGDWNIATMEAILRAINLYQLNASIIAPQPNRAASVNFPDFSQPFIDKHAARNDPEAKQVAEDRFNEVPPAPLSQNLNRDDEDAFKGLNRLMADLAGRGYFAAVEQTLAAQRDERVREQEAIQSIQYVFPSQYMVQTYRPVPAPVLGGRVGAARAGGALQLVQLAFTHTGGIANRLIANHFVTPDGADAPAPNTIAWHELPWEDFQGLVRNAGSLQPNKRPRVFFDLTTLNQRTDL